MNLSVFSGQEEINDSLSTEISSRLTSGLTSGTIDLAAPPKAALWNVGQFYLIHRVSQQDPLDANHKNGVHSPKG